MVQISLPTTAAYGFTATVDFTGAPAATVTSWPAGMTFLTVPAEAESGPVTVTVVTQPVNNPLGLAAGDTAQVIFSVPTPAITSATAESPSGVACTIFAAGQPLTISGTGFGAAQGPSAVLLDGTPDSAVTWYPGPVGGSHETLTVTVPSDLAPGRHSLAVRTGGGTSNALGIETGPAASAGCGETAASPPTHATTSGGSGGAVSPQPPTAPSPSPSPSKPTPPATPPKTPPTSPNALTIAGPASLGVGGQAAYALMPASIGAIRWASSNPAIATVTAQGIVTAHHAGSVTLSAVSGDRSVAKSLQVLAAAPASGSGKPVSAPKTSSVRRQGPPAAEVLLGVLLLLAAMVLLLVVVRRRRSKQHAQVHEGQVS